jgi:hypothetical protein
MMVPESGSNLVCLEDGKDFSIREGRAGQSSPGKNYRLAMPMAAVGKEYGSLKAGSRVFRITPEPKKIRETWFEATKGKDTASILDGLSEIFGSDKDIEEIQGKKASGEVISVFLAGKKIVTRERDYPMGFLDLTAEVVVVKDQDECKNTLKTVAHEIAHHRYFKRNLPGEHAGYKKDGYEIFFTPWTGTHKDSHAASSRHEPRLIFYLDNSISLG